jgi:6-phosphogluconolactonase (cycloisomerase 2 family)
MAASAGVAADAAPPTSQPSANVLYVVLSPLFTTGPSAVARFDLEDDGRPRFVATYETGGLARAFTSPQAMTFEARKKLLFVINNESDDVSVFRLQPDGSLDPAVRRYPAGGWPVSLALLPSGEFLYVGDASDGSVHVLHVDRSGALAHVQDVSASLWGDIEASPRGDRLFVATWRGIRVYAISAEGTLEEIAGSPFPINGDRTRILRLDASGRRLFALDLDTGVTVYDVDSAGALVPVAGSPYVVSSFANAMTLARDDAFLYVSSPYDATLSAFRVGGRGKLNEVRDSPFAADYQGTSVVSPADSAWLNQVGRDTERISVFGIGANGGLTETAYSPVDVPDAQGRVPNGAIVLPLAPFVPVGP